MRGEAKVTLLQACCISLPCDTALWTRSVLHECFFDSCFILPVTDGKIEQCVCVKFCPKLSKSTTETLEMLCEAFGERCLSRAAVFERHSRFRAGRLSVDDVKCSGWPSTSKTKRKFWKNLKTHPSTMSLNNPWAHRHNWNESWSLPGYLNRKFEHAPHCGEVWSPTLDKWSEAVAHKRVSWAVREG
jgi:hypothetical protein